MDDDQSGRRRSLLRGCEIHRLEQLLLNLAYEKLWPVSRVETAPARKKLSSTAVPVRRRHQVPQVLGG
jgi:hypothetical protein